MLQYRRDQAWHEPREGEIMFKVVAVIVAIFAVIVIGMGTAILVFGIKQRIHERRNCTVDARGVVKEKIYDDSVIHVGSEVKNGVEYACGLRLLINLNGVEYDVFNKIYDTAYYKYREGDVVPVKVNPDDPSEYYISEGTSQGVSLFLIGAGMIAFGVIMIKYFWF